MSPKRSTGASSGPLKSRAGKAPVQSDLVGRPVSQAGRASTRHDAIANSLTSYATYRRWADHAKRSWDTVSVKP